MSNPSGEFGCMIMKGGMTGSLRVNSSLLGKQKRELSPVLLGQTFLSFLEIFFAIFFALLPEKGVKWVSNQLYKRKREHELDEIRDLRDADAWQRTLTWIGYKTASP